MSDTRHATVSEAVDLPPDDIALADKMNAGRQQILTELRKIIIGQEEVIDQVLMTLFVGGNSLIVGAPGLAKTLLVHTISRVVDLKFSRIQFTPDLMPSDITGTDLVQEDPATGRRADGVRARAGVREHRAGRRDQPHAARRRSRRCSRRCRSTASPSRAAPISWPSRSTCSPRRTRSSSRAPIRCPRPSSTGSCSTSSSSTRPTARSSTSCGPRRGCRTRTCTSRCRGDDLISFQRLVRKVPVAEPVMRHALDIVRASRSKDPDAKDFVKKWVAFGASVRAAQYLVLGGKARALTSGRYHVSFEDIRALAHPVLRHRIITNFHAQSESVTTDDIVDRLLEVVPLPRSGM